MTKLFFIIEVCYKTSATSYQVEKIESFITCNKQSYAMISLNWSVSI